MRLINYATPDFEAWRRLGSATALWFGGFERVTELAPRHIDDAFRCRNADILRQPRGAGYWLWKPYFIERTLGAMADGEILCYADSAYVFLRSMAPLVEVMRRTDTDVMAFRLLVQIERVWTKRDAFVLMDCDAAAPCCCPTRASTACTGTSTPAIAPSSARRSPGAGCPTDIPASTRRAAHRSRTACTATAATAPSVPAGPIANARATSAAMSRCGFARFGAGPPAPDGNAPCASAATPVPPPHPRRSRR